MDYIKKLALTGTVGAALVFGVAGTAFASPNVPPTALVFCTAAARFGDLTSLARFDALTDATRAAGLPGRFARAGRAWEQHTVSFGPRATAGTLRRDAAHVQVVCRSVNGY